MHQVSHLLVKRICFICNNQQHCLLTKRFCTDKSFTVVTFKTLKRNRFLDFEKSYPRIMEEYIQFKESKKKKPKKAKENKVILGSQQGLRKLLPLDLAMLIPTMMVDEIINTIEYIYFIWLILIYLKCGCMRLKCSCISYLKCGCIHLPLGILILTATHFM